MGVAEDSSKHVHVFVAKSYTGSIHSVCKLNQWVLKDFVLLASMQWSCYSASSPWVGTAEVN